MSEKKIHNYLSKLRQFVRQEKLCEIESAHGVTATGIIKEVGKDYLTINRAVERTITTMEEPDVEETDTEEGKKIPVERIEIVEFETVLKLNEIIAVSQIVRKTIK